MAQATFENVVHIQTAPEFVVSFLSTLDRHAEVHPLIVAIREVARAPSDAPECRRYAIRDRLRVGPFTLYVTYLAVVRPDPDSSAVLSEAFQFPAIHLRNTTRCIADGTGTRVEEHVVVRAPWPLLGYVVSQARRAHVQMLLNLKLRLEAA